MSNIHMNEFSLAKEQQSDYEICSLDGVVKHLVEWVIKQRESDLKFNKTVSGTKEELDKWLINEDVCNAEIKLAKEIIRLINPEHEIIQGEEV